MINNNNNNNYELIENHNNKKQKLDNINLNLKTDVCIYTQQQTFDILYQEITLPDVLLFIIIEYSNIYREDHLQSYKFYSMDTPFKTVLLDRLLDEKTNYRIQVIIAPRQVGKTQLEIDFLLRKEIEYKEKNKPYNAAIFSSGKRAAFNFAHEYFANREYLNEKWMQHDIKFRSKYTFKTKNQFKVIIQEVTKCNAECILDTIIVDEFIFRIQSKSKQLLFQNAKRIILISSADDDIDQLKTNIKQWSEYTNNGNNPIELIQITKNSTDINDNTVSSKTEII